MSHVSGSVLLHQPVPQGGLAMIVPAVVDGAGTVFLSQSATLTTERQRRYLTVTAVRFVEVLVHYEAIIGWRSLPHGRIYAFVHTLNGRKR